MSEPTIYERDGWRWINRCARCDAETFLEADPDGEEWWICDSGHTCDLANEEIVQRPGSSSAESSHGTGRP